MSNEITTTKMTRRNFFRVTGGAVAGILFWKISVTSADGSETTRTYMYLVDTTLCIGCGNCVRACGRENDVPEGSYRTWVERYAVTNHDRVLVDSPDGGKDGFGPLPDLDDGEKISKSFFVPKLCNHCANPPCVQVCPVGATFTTPDGVVLVDSEWCVGCGYCVQSCPYAARFINEETHTADKCSWCYHRITRGLQPACVSVCPVGARRFEEVGADSDVEKIVREQRVGVLKQDLGTEPRVYYLGLTREVR